MMTNKVVICASVIYTYSVSNLQYYEAARVTGVTLRGSVSAMSRSITLS